MKTEENVDVAGIKTRQIVEAFFEGVEPAWGRQGGMIHMAECI